MELTIPGRFNGPPGSGNGGVTAGLLAGFLTGGSAVRVTLRRPPPLDRPLHVDLSDARAALLDGDILVAEAAPIGDETLGDAVAAVGPEAATRAALDYAGLRTHPFPTCFACGTDRLDGLGLRPGPVSPDPGSTPDPHRTATPFVPRWDIEAHVMWAVLDCPGGWAIDQPNRPAVLGRMTARLTALPEAGEPCVVVGVLEGREGRKAHTRTTAYGHDGRELGRAHATWIEVARP